MLTTPNSKQLRLLTLVIGTRIQLLHLGLKLTDGEVGISVALRLAIRSCSPHNCVCSKLVDARGLYGLSCRRSTQRHQRYAMLNDIIWRSIKRPVIHFYLYSISSLQTLCWRALKIMIMSTFYSALVRSNCTRALYKTTTITICDAEHESCRAYEKL